MLSYDKKKSFFLMKCINFVRSWENNYCYWQCISVVCTHKEKVHGLVHQPSILKLSLSANFLAKSQSSNYSIVKLRGWKPNEWKSKTGNSRTVTGDKILSLLLKVRCAECSSTTPVMFRTVWCVQSLWDGLRLHAMLWYTDTGWID